MRTIKTRDETSFSQIDFSSIITNGHSRLRRLQGIRPVRRRSSFGAVRPSGLEAKGFARLAGLKNPRAE